MMFAREVLGRNDIRPTSAWLRGLQIGAIVGVLAGIVMLGAWRLLVCPLVVIPLLNVCELLKRVYWKGFDPFIWKASDEARFKTVLFWNMLTLFLDWMITLLPTIACLYIVEGIASGLDVPFTLRLFLFWCCAFSFRLGVAGTINFATDATLVLRGCVVFVCALVSLSLPMTPVHVVLALLVATLVVFPFNVRAILPNVRKDYERLLNETRRGIVHDYRQPSGWFPRPGVVFEPQFNFYSPLGADVFKEIRPALTILRVNVCGFFLSLAMLIGGIVWICCLGRGLLLLATPVLAVLGLVYGLQVSEVDRKMSEAPHAMRGIFTIFSVCGIALPTIYFGGDDLTALMALGLLYSASWYFFTGFLVRGSSIGVFDTQEFLLSSASIACTVLARVNVCNWWESLLPALLFGFLHSRLRRHFLRADLPQARSEPSAASCEPETRQSRHARKRERQLAAFRRSARRQG